MPDGLIGDMLDKKKQATPCSIPEKYQFKFMMCLDDIKTLSHIQNITKHINGSSINNGEGCVLYMLARGKGNVLEIGSYKGRSTIFLAYAISDLAHVFAIDPHYSGTLTEFIDNLKEAKCKHRVTPYVLTSKEAHKRLSNIGLFDVIFIDGDHSYTSVKEDFKLWYPFLSKDGVMVFHDMVGIISNIDVLTCDEKEITKLKKKRKDIYWGVIRLGREILRDNYFEDVRMAFNMCIFSKPRC